MGIPLSLSEVPAATPSAQYIATAGQTVFPYPFPITQDSDLVVVVNGVTQSVDVGYSLSGQGNALGGFVTFGTGLAGGSVVTVYRDIIIERVTQIAQNSGFSSVAFNAEFNNIYLILQQLANQLAFSLQIPFSNSPAPITTLQPGTYANSILSFDASGNPQPALFTPDGVLTASATAALLAGYLAAPSAPDKVLTTAEIAASVTPVNYGFREGDIRRYGASTVAGDNSTAINDALLVSANVGAAAYIPPGVWNITSPLVATLNCCMEGEGGLVSVIVATGCDGLQFSQQPSYGGGRFFRAFGLVGSDATNSNYNAISVVIASGRLTGIVFQDLNVANWAAYVYVATSVSGQGGLWNSEFRNCFAYNCYQGYYFNGQVIQLQIEGGMVQAAGIAQPVSGPLSGVVTRYGLYTALGAGIQPQSLHCKGMGIYAYDTLIRGVYLFYAAFTDCDLSQFQGTIGVEITTVQGNIVFDNTWIQAGNANANPVIGIKIDELGADAPQKIVVNGCNFRGNGVAGSMGIYCGGDQSGISITNNTIGSSTNSFDYGIAGIGGTPGASSHNLYAKFNTIYALTADISLNSSAINSDIGPNVNQNAGVSKPFLCGTSPTGMRFTAPGMRGTAAFSAATTVAVVFATAMPNATYGISLGGNAAGYVWPTSKATTGFTINCSGSNSNSTDWAVAYG